MKSSQLVFAAIAIAVIIHSAPLARVNANEDFRLPIHTVPIGYDIKLIPYLEDNNFWFNGEVDITVQVSQPTATIVLHADQLDIYNSTVTSVNPVPTITDRTYDQERQFFTLIFATALTSGSYSINLQYTGPLHDDFRGFHRNYYNTSSGQIRWYAISFFAPTYARRAFPCFDEPALKATFDISIAHWPNQSVISNTLSQEVSLPDSSIGNRVWTKFYTTPSMSTYLVAFMVSDFEHVANDDGLFRIWSRPEALGTANHSLASVSLLNQLGTYTGIHYNTILSKMDQVALPNSATVAMENWGMVTHREPWILWQDGVSTTRDKQNIDTVVAHEFSHQWFGNLVTPEWWKYVWLSEGFATFFEYYTAAQVHPSWRLMEQFTVNHCHRALLDDSLDTTRPMNLDVYTPVEIDSIFDVISYQKGACVLRMLSNVLGESVFQTGLQIYQANNSYGTGDPDKLWQALTMANNMSSDGLLLTHVDIKTVMDTWTNQKGYPLVTVTRNYTSLTQEISQERFLLKGRGSSNDTTEYRWWVPFNFASQTNLNFDFTGSNNWIRAQDESVMISGFLPTDWVIYNVRQTGFYRVNYDNENWNMIAEYLRTSNFTNIPPATRAQLIDDAFNLARAGYLNYTIALSLTEYLTQETDYVPWAAAFKVYAYLQRMLAQSDYYGALQSYLFSRVLPIHAGLGYAVPDTDDHVTSFLRAESHSWACRMGCPGCFAQSHGFIQNYYNSDGNSPIHPDLRGWAYCEGLRNASIDVWNFMWDRYLLTDIAGEQILILTGLGCSLDEGILNRYLDFSISANSGIRSHQRLTVFNSVYTGSPFNVEVALVFLLNNVDAAAVAYGGYDVIERLLQTLATYLVSDSQLAPLRTFILQNNTVGTTVSAAERAVEIAEENIAWLNIYGDDITRWLTATHGAGNSLVALSPILLVIVSVILNSAY